MERITNGNGHDGLVQVSVGEVTLEGNLLMLEETHGVVPGLHGGGTSRHGSRTGSRATRVGLIRSLSERFSERGAAEIENAGGQTGV